jgi:carbamoyltransferase
MNRDIIGLNFGHDATVVLLRDGKVEEAIMEERVSRVKKYIGFPHEALAYLKNKYDIKNFDKVFVDGIDSGVHIINTKQDVIDYRLHLPERKWFLKAVIEKLHLGNFIYGVKNLIGKIRFVIKGHKNTARNFLRKEFPTAIIENVPHHLSHAWATVLFMEDRTKKYLILTLDGEGDSLCGSINIFENGDIKVLHEFSNINSLGLLYASFVDLLGMSRNEHEFKVMGLAPYAKASSGEKVYKELKKIICFDTEKMNLVSTIDMRRATQYLIANEFSKYRFDSLAYGIQKLTEEIIKEIARESIKKYNCADLATGGGVFMNVKANQYLREMVEVKSLLVAPSAGDESIALGNAVYGYAKEHNHDLSKLKKIPSLYLGSSYTDNEIKSAIDQYQFDIPVTVTYYDPQGETTIEQKVAELLAKNSVVGRFKGRAEWGARALGNRSILANPMSRDNVKLINEMIKGRDFWMPFATSMLYERRNDYLEDADTYLAPYMAITFNTKPKAHTELIAALHPYDLTSRPQMVQKETNPEYHALISHFEKLTGVGGILNTSFNLHGEPNVEKPEDALRTFALSGLPYLAIGNYLVGKNI